MRRGLVAGWIVAALLLSPGCQAGGGAQLPQDPLLRTLERKSGLIVYIGTDRNIYTIDQGGGNQKAVTSDAGTIDEKLHFYQFPTWSPDGQLLAFAKFIRTSQAVEQASIFTAAPDGTNPVEAFSSDEALPIYLYWSPDNQHVSFLTTTTSGSVVLQLTPARGGDSQVLDTGSPYYWSWAPDGQSILIHAGGAAQQQPQARLAFLNLAGGVTEEGLDLRPSAFQAPAWSPDGSQLLLAAETDDGQQALLVTDPRGAVKNVLKTLEGSTAFGWSPDGKQVAYIAAGGDQTLTIGPLTVLDLQTPEEAKTTEQEAVLAFFWSPDNERIAYFVPLVVRPTAEPNQSGQPETTILLRLYMLDVKTGAAREVTTFYPTQEFLTTLQYFDQYQRSATIWSPDSKNLVLAGFFRSSDANAALGVWVIAASGNLEPRFLTEGVLAYWSWK
ncbi:MAG TPA: hypothetical protein VJG32_09135 [Anaerolineae bacterium]|nr:hypothetical protein [Anaerolineae bacterium]